MKKLTAITLTTILLSLFSCKKDRTCVCTYTKAGSPNSDTQINNYYEVSKKTALATCNSGNTYDQAEPWEVHTRNCELK